MSKKKDPEINSIIEGFQMLGSETGGLINPNEFKEIMEIMNMKEKNPFLYNIIEKFCTDPKVEKKGGIEAEDFISQLEDELNDTSSMEGLYNLFTVFFNPITNKIPITTFSQIAKNIGNDEEEKIKYLTNKAQLGDKELNFNEFNEIIPLEPSKKQNEKMIYKKKSSKMDGRESFHKYNKKNNVYNKVNNKANNYMIKNYDEMSAENLNDSIKNDEITFNGNKYNNQIENETEYDKINVDVNNFDNDKNNYKNNYEITEEPKEKITKKKYGHVKKTQSTNYEEEVERNRNNGNNNEYEMKENGADQKEKDGMPKNGKYRYARSKGEIKGNKDKDKDRDRDREIDDMEESEDLTERKDFNNDEKSDVKANKRYHRRYREAKSNTPDRNEKLNNASEN